MIIVTDLVLSLLGVVGSDRNRTSDRADTPGESKSNNTNYRANTLDIMDRQ